MPVEMSGLMVPVVANGQKFRVVLILKRAIMTRMHAKKTDRASTQLMSGEGIILIAEVID